MATQQQSEPPKKKQRAPRGAADPPKRAQNINSLKQLAGTTPYGKESLDPIVKSIAAIVAVDYFNGVVTSAEPTSLWGCLINASESGDIEQLKDVDIGVPPPFNLAEAAIHVTQIGASLKMLAQRAKDVEEDMQTFQDTFLYEIATVTDIKRDETIDGEQPLECQIIRSPIPAKHTTRLQLTHVKKDVPVQTIVVAAKLVPVVDALHFVMNLPTTLYDKSVQRLMYKALKSRELIACVSKRHQAYGSILADETDSSVKKRIGIEINKTIQTLKAVATKFGDVRKLVIASAVSEPTTGQLEFTE